MNKIFGVLTLAGFCAMAFAQDVENNGAGEATPVTDVPATAEPETSEAVADSAMPVEKAVPVEQIAQDSSSAEVESGVALGVEPGVATETVAAEPAAEPATEPAIEPAAEPAADSVVSTVADTAASPAPVVEQPVAPAEKSVAVAEAPEKPKLILSNEPTFAIEIQPISLTFYPMFRHGLTFYATVEVVVNSNASVITRPYYASKTISKSLQSGEVSIYGLTEGFRYYFDRKHVGWFASANFTFEYIQVEHKFNDVNNDDIKDTGNSIGFGLYLGRKYQIGNHFVTSLDAGLIYNQAFIDKGAKKDVNDVTNEGVGFDINYTLGFAF